MQSAEINISSITHAVNHNSEFARLLISTVTKEPVQYDDIHAYTNRQVQYLPGNYIVIKACAADRCDLFIIENKVNCETDIYRMQVFEGGSYARQLKATLENQPPYGRWNHTFPVFLSLLPYQKIADGGLHYVTYEQIIRNLERFPGARNVPDPMLVDFLSTCSSFYDSVQPHPDDLIIEQLKTRAPESSLLYLQRTLITAKLPEELGLYLSCWTSGTGHGFCFAAFTKEGWSSETTPEEAAHRIHIEPQFDPRIGLTFRLHYETAPYAPEDKLANHFSDKQLAAYRQRRERFKEYMRQHAPVGFTVRGGCNQIGMRPVCGSDGKITTGEFQTAVRQFASRLCPVVDGSQGRNG